MENLGVLVFQVSNIPLEVMRGFSISETPYPTIIINRADNPFARIFSIIHEFVHINSADKEVNAFANEAIISIKFSKKNREQKEFENNLHFRYQCIHRFLEKVLSQRFFFPEYGIF